MGPGGRQRQPSKPSAARAVKGSRAGLTDGSGVFGRSRAGQPVSDAEKVSTTDPDAILAAKGGGTARMAYYDNYLVDTPVG